MNKNLGKFLFALFTLWHVESFASSYEWSAQADKKIAFVNEPIYLTYSCHYSDRAELFSIEFNPVGEHEKYSVKLLSQNSKIENGKKEVHYEFVAFAKVAGEVNFEFDMVMKKTNKESIENTVIGRDNLEKEEFSARVMRQESLRVEVKETQSDLVGAFAISVQKESPKVKAYEPFHMEIILQGKGNFDAQKPYLFSLEGVKVFSEEPTQKITLTKDGYVGMWNQKFAFVSDKSFEIPPISLRYFDIHEKKIKEVSFEAVPVEVSKAFEKEELLETDESQIPFFRWEYLYYVLTFLAGFMVSKIKFKRSVTHAKNDSFAQKVHNTKTLEELCLVLILKDAKKYSDFILKIEKKEIISLKEAKQTLEHLIVN